MTEQDVFRMLKDALITAAPSRAAEFRRLELGAVDALVLDSLTTLEVVNVVEARIGTKFDDEQLLTLRSIRDMIAMIQRLSAHQGTPPS